MRLSTKYNRLLPDRSLLALHQGGESLSRAEHHVALRPAVSQALQLGLSPSQTHEAAQLGPGGDRDRGNPGNIYLHMPGIQNKDLQEEG